MTHRTLEALLATQQLEAETRAAEASSPETYEQFIEKSEQEAVKDAQAASEGTGDGETPGVADTTDEADTGTVPAESNPSDEFSDDDSIDADEERDELSGQIKAPSPTESEVTTESWGDAARAVAGTVMDIGRGLYSLGITYGPGIASGMYKGVVWGFSRMGSLIAVTTKHLSRFTERSLNSMSLLEKRLIAARTKINEVWDTDPERLAGEYTRRPVISLLKVGGNVGFAYNVNAFTKELLSTTTSLGAEIEGGYRLVEELSRVAGKRRPDDIGSFMQVNGARLGMVRGSVRGYADKTGLVAQFHSRPLPGDTLLIFNAPVTQGRDMGQIVASYKASEMFLGFDQQNFRNVSSVKHLSIQELSTLHMSLIKLHNACKTSMQLYGACAKAQPGLVYSVKKLFLRLSDDSAKTRLADSLIEPIYLRASLASGVLVSGGMDLHTHATRVIAAGLTLIEDHLKKMS